MKENLQIFTSTSFKGSCKQWLLTVQDNEIHETNGQLESDAMDENEIRAFKSRNVIIRQAPLSFHR